MFSSRIHTLLSKQRTNKILIPTTLLFFGLLGPKLDAQQLKQTVRGTIIDQETKMPLPSASILVLGSTKPEGTTTDLNGEFRLENIPVGRLSLKISFIGYQDRVLSNLLISSSKELVLNIELQESLAQLDAVLIVDTKNKNEVLNEMALVSARSFSVEETQRYAGAIDDPARMVASFAGVNGDAEGDNDIVVRGNSPRGILWRLEGIEIPNPNHFASEGGTGGPINALNSNMLANSDFYTGAFAPEYGNALSGVFDMKLRTGNNERREYSATASILGLDATIEGPFNKNYRGSYIANYRYSSLSLLDDAGIVDFGGVPKYQDASFKMVLPINSKHSLQMFGLGGISSISQTDIDEDNDDELLSDSQFGSDLGVLGLSHLYLINSKTFLQSKVSMAGTRSTSFYKIPDDDQNLYIAAQDDFVQSNYKAISTINYKLNARNNFKTGFIFTGLYFNLESEYWDSDLDKLIPTLSQNANSSMVQGFVNWKHRFNEKLSLVSGLHYIRFNLNKNASLEPRLALQWKANDKNSFTIGSGLHSKIESISIYMGEHQNGDLSFSNPNRNLDFTKSLHFMAGYDRTLNAQTHLKFELYYQHLYDVPIDSKANSNYSLLNSSGGFTTKNLVNQGLGTNYGMEFTLEQFLNKGFYYMSTVSIYRSLYTAQNGDQRASRYDGQYVANFLMGKEFKIGKSKKDRVFFTDLKIAFIGAQRYSPIILDASILEGDAVRDLSNPFSAKGDDIFKLDLSVGVRRNKKKISTEFKIAVQNATNNGAVTNEYYEHAKESIEQGKQLPLLPVISYKINF